MSLCDAHARLTKHAIDLAKKKRTAPESAARYIDMLGTDLAVGLIALETIMSVAEYVNQDESICCEGYGLEYCCGYKKALEDVAAIIDEALEDDDV